MKDALVKSLSALLDSPNDIWCEAAKNGEVYKSEPPTTGTSSVSAIIPSFYSTSSEIAKERRYGLGTCIVLRAGRNSLSRW